MKMKTVAVESSSELALTEGVGEVTLAGTPRAGPFEDAELIEAGTPCVPLLSGEVTDAGTPWSEPSTPCDVMEAGMP